MISYDAESDYKNQTAFREGHKRRSFYGTLSDSYALLATERFDTEGVEIRWFPHKALGKEYEDVPINIASAASEAYSCFSVNANRAAVLMARTAIEATAKDKAITSGSLKEKIGKMAEQHVITDQLADEAHEIRLLGNDMAHGDLDEPVTEDDASDILGFLDSVLDYVYQQPMAIQKRKELRERRKQQQ